MISNDEIRALWRDNGGKFFGPRIEHGSMEEKKLLPFLRIMLEGSNGLNAAKEEIQRLRSRVEELESELRSLNDGFFG